MWEKEGCLFAGVSCTRVITVLVFLRAVCKLLEVEKRQHEELKMTWQMANDQFLESQRLMMMDMRRMESVLSAEQQRQIQGAVKPRPL